MPFFVAEILDFSEEKTSVSALYKGRKVVSLVLAPATNVIIRGVSKDIPFFVAEILDFNEEKTSVSALNQISWRVGSSLVVLKVQFELSRKASKLEGA